MKTTKEERERWKKFLDAFNTDIDYPEKMTKFYEEGLGVCGIRRLCEDADECERVKDDLRTLLNIGRIDASDWTQDRWRASIRAALTGS